MLAISLALLVSVTLPAAQDQAASGALREELAALLRSGRIDQAIGRAQAALKRAPDDPLVQNEYITLHLSLARMWFGRSRFDDCLSALSAVEALQPKNEAARSLRKSVSDARKTASARLPEVERWIRIERFETALDLAKEIQRIRPDLAARLASPRRAATLGAADDHYLARNAHEAFALYEQVLALTVAPAPEVATRWGISLGLALAESDNRPNDVATIQRLRKRLNDVIRAAGDRVGFDLVRALLLEASGRDLDARHAYAEALEQNPRASATTQGARTLAALHASAIEKLHELHDQNRPQRRGELWRIVLPDVWKHRQTAHFDVYARNDLIAQRIAEAAEEHLTRINAWLGADPIDHWTPRCELRVHATLDELHAATKTTGITRAVTRTQLQGKQVLLRKVELFQDDDWLIGGTLPHELTHVLLAEAHRSPEFPTAIDEGLALQAEPPARRLQFRRYLAADGPSLAALLALRGPAPNELSFYAECDAVTTLLLSRAARVSESAHTPAASVSAAFAGGRSADWFRRFGFESEKDEQRVWGEWRAARRNAPRMPLLIRGAPTTRSTRDRQP